MRAAIPLALAISLIASPIWADDTAKPETAAPEVMAAVPTYAEAQAAIDAADFPTAQRILAQLTVTDPDNADVWNLFGYASRNMNLAGPALEAYDMALTLNPDHLGALEYQGELFVTLDRLDDAQKNLAKLKKLCGDCEQAVDLEAAIAAAPVEEVKG
jgi:predicted Zn-dependent protease